MIVDTLQILESISAALAVAAIGVVVRLVTCSSLHREIKDDLRNRHP